MEIEEKVKEIVNLIEKHLDPEEHNTQDIEVAHDESSIWINHKLETDYVLIYTIEISNDDDEEAIANEALSEIGEAIGERLI